MPRYNFRIRDGVAHPNPGGLELTGIVEARLTALQLSESLLREHAGESWINDDWQLVVTDAHGRAVFVLQISSINETQQPSAIPRY
jgi:hypothetical protein